MTIKKPELDAIKKAIRLAELHGYGNLIAHLASAWACKLVQQGLNESTALEFVSGRGPYPLAMHKDIIDYGGWDETGKRYQEVRSC